MVSSHPSVGETQWGPVNKGLCALSHLPPLLEDITKKKMAEVMCGMVWNGVVTPWYGMVMVWKDNGVMTDGSRNGAMTKTMMMAHGMV